MGRDKFNHENNNASLLRGEKAKKRREAMDDQAAAVILQDYLDNSKPQPTGELRKSKLTTFNTYFPLLSDCDRYRCLHDVHCSIKRKDSWFLVRTSACSTIYVTPSICGVIL